MFGIRGFQPLLIATLVTFGANAWGTPLPKVSTSCSEPERSKLFYPKRVWTEPSPAKLDLLICQSMSELLNLTDLAERNALSETPISMDCWTSVADYWKQLKLWDSQFVEQLKTVYAPGSPPYVTLNFLKTEGSTFVELMRSMDTGLNFTPNYTASQALVCRNDTPLKSVSELIKSSRLAIFNRMRVMGCDKRQTEQEMEKLATEKLSTQYGWVYDSCKNGPGSAMSRLRKCEAVQKKTIQQLAQELRNGNTINQYSCAVTLDDTSQGTPGSDAVFRKMSACIEQEEQINAGKEQLRANPLYQGKRTLVGIEELNLRQTEKNFQERCSGFFKECDSLKASAVEYNSDFCAIPKGMAKQSSNTCALHAISTAIFMAGPGCPQSNGKFYSIGQMIKFTNKSHEAFQKEGTQKEDFEAISKQLFQRGVKIKTAATLPEEITNLMTPSKAGPKTSWQKNPMIVNVFMNDVKTTFKEALVTTASQSSESAAGHAMLITGIFSRPDENGRSVIYANLRDANFSYDPVEIPLETLVGASKYYSESCTDNCAPAVIEVERKN